MDWFCSNSSKNLFVKIVHPGGHVELHDRPILAAELLNRNPKCCVAHPTVFQQPHAIVSPETTLLLGKKYYVVPLGTIRKLQLKHPPNRSRGDHAAARRTVGVKSSGDSDRDRDSDSSSACWLFRNIKNGGTREKRDATANGGGSGTKVSATSSESSGYETTEVMMVRRERGGGGRRTGDGGTTSPGRISLVSMENWQPGLHSICEEF